MNKKGFSLLELIIAMLILSITTVGAMSLTLICNKFVLGSKQRYQAVSQAQAMLERLRYYVSADPNVDKALDITMHPATDINYTPPKPDKTGGINYTCNYEVKSLNDSNTRCRHVVSTVQWDGL